MGARVNSIRIATAIATTCAAFAAAPASAAAALDTVTASGSSAVIPTNPPLFPPAQYTNVDISAQSGPGGQNLSGFASFTFGPFHLSGEVTCLSVTGPDNGAGTAGAPTTAVLNFIDLPPDAFAGDVITAELIDNGGNGADIISSAPSTSGTQNASNCPAPFTGSPLSTAPLTGGRAVVFDAPVLPTSKDQCKDGGWRQFPGFRSQGECVAFVQRRTG
jgi:hypothetical protein